MNVEGAIFDMFEDKWFGLVCKGYFRNVGLSKEWTACSRNFWTRFVAAMNNYFMVRCGDAIVQDFLQVSFCAVGEEGVLLFEHLDNSDLTILAPRNDATLAKCRAANWGTWKGKRKQQ